MVKVKDEDMAEPKSAQNQNIIPIRKSRNQPNHIHFHQTYHHYTYYHHHFSYPAENVDSRDTSPAKFYFGPAFEAQAPIPGGCPVPSMDYNQYQNTSEYVVYFHVNPGVTVSFQIGDNLEILVGPVTVPMVSTNSSPPIAMPVQVPPGHVVQQIVDETGTLRHVILSTQHSAGLVPLSTHNPQHFGASTANGTNPPQQAFYQGIPAGFAPTHFHSIIPSPTRLGHSPPPPQTHYKDERAQKQHNKLKKKIYDKQKKGDNILHSSSRNDMLNGLKRPTTDDKGMDSVGTSEDGEESSIPDEEDSVQLIADVLSSVQAPKVSELSSRSALLQWAPPTKLSEVASSDSQEVDISERDLRYEVLLSDKSKEMKFKSIYSGDSLSCRIQDLRPGQEYSVCLQAHLDELQGSATDPIKFTTPPCEPDQPQPPKLQQRLKNSLHLRWNSVNDNGSHISNYLLEYDEGKGGDFVEFHRSKGKQHILHKLQPGTAYRFRLAAINDIGKSLYSDIVTYYTCSNPPSKPNPPYLAETAVNYLHVKWDRRGTDDDYVLQMNDPRFKYYLPVYNGRDSSYVCTELTNYTDYRFRLRAENDGGPSLWSDEVVLRTLPDRPSRPSKPIVKGRIHAHSFKLKWEPPLDTGGSDITEYVLEVNSGSGYRTVYTGGETEAVCDKLTPGTTYQLRVCCKSSGGVSNYSDPCTVTTDAISPGQCPQPKLVGKPKPNSISIKLIEPDYNGGAPVLEYEVELTHPDSTTEILHKSKQLECTATNLNPGCLYSFIVRGVNRIGPGVWSDPLKVTSGAAPPNTPEPPIVINKSPFHVFVEWQAPNSNGAPILEYNLQSSLDDFEENFHTIYVGNDLSHDIKSLQPFTAYYFRVQAINNAGASNFSNKTATMTPAAPPATITSIQNRTTPTTIYLTWNEPQNNGAPITHYNIEIGDKLVATTSDDTEYIFEKLEPNTVYKIKIQAVNTVGAGSFSSTLRVSTLRLPPQPPKLECAGVGSNYLKLKWGDGKNPDYIQYSLEMENLRSRDFQCIYKGTALTYKVNRLHEEITYRFRINASNDAGIGDYSDVYSFKTSIALPNPVKTVKIIDVDHRCCTLEWLPSRNTFQDPILYQVQISDNKQNFNEVYRGIETKTSLDSLESGREYAVRVCPFRVVAASDEFLQGTYSPIQSFTTPVECNVNSNAVNSLTTTSSKQSSTSTSNLTSQSHNKKSQKLFTSNKLHLIRTKAIAHPPIFYAFLITIAGIILAMFITSFLKV